MAVHIRLSRAGAKKRPFYRLVVTDHRSPRNGRFLENIGTFDPSQIPPKNGFTIKAERLAYWTSVGATPSATVERLLKLHATQLLQQTTSLKDSAAAAAPAA